MADLILIVGVTGYIGFQTLAQALKAGYKVRAVIRRADQSAKLLAHASISPYASNLEFSVVPDMAKEGAFDSAIDRVSAVVHLASPLAIETDDYQRDIIDPAIAINVSILTAAAKTPTVRRVVITSSAVTLVPFQWLSSPNSAKFYTSSDINLGPKGPYGSAMEAYWASKALARFAVREFMKNNTPSFDFVALLPSVVIGSDPRAESTKDVLEGTRALVLGPVLGNTAPFPMVGVPIHVSDVARAHVAALKPSVTGNSEYILSSDSPKGIEWDQALTIAKKYFAEDCGPGKILPLGGTFPSTLWQIDGQSAEKALGFKFISYEDTMKGLIAQYIDLKKKEMGS